MKTPIFQPSSLTSIRRAAAHLRSFHNHPLPQQQRDRSEAERRPSLLVYAGMSAEHHPQQSFGFIASLLPRITPPQTILRYRLPQCCPPLLLLP
ncbi:hypothetical protein JTE90_029708 [Oedothorax gibbosus]|uniref:Uncharacterized protein n=1 Tax=Oedothorax gibbosus TaxID=931172 RepID=A0AAV6UN95_9ARAC|nr:hypothetical protein JTE90_029708 [Oedothorax gibbosus]